MNRSSFDPLYDLDPEIEITLRRLRKARSIVVSNSFDSVFSSDNSSLITNTSDSVEFSSTNNFSRSEQMENNDRTLKELATLDVVYQPWCNLGASREDPHKHLNEFHVGIPKDYIKMKAFPFSLDGAAQDWLYLQPVLFNTWET
ncbi:hypothetical protein CR513_46882, partial [Mucuna pruriens]